MNDSVPGGTGRMTSIIRQVLVVAVPLMISTASFSLVLFADRTLLLWYDPPSLSSAMAGGNLFWVACCMPVGIASMTGAIVGQMVGDGTSHRAGCLMWQTIYASAALVPACVVLAWVGPRWFAWTGQPAQLIAGEGLYFRWLMTGAVAEVLQTGLAGYFAGINRTQPVMIVGTTSAALNLGLDLALIPSFGLTGAAIASVSSFWFKVAVYLWLLRGVLAKSYELGDWRPNRRLLQTLLYFGLPAGLMYATESGAFTFILFQIGRLGDMPLRATAMAINFNMLAFVPLVGLSTAASVLVGRHLVESGPAVARRYVHGCLCVAWLYSAAWAILYLLFAGPLMSVYASADRPDPQTAAVASGLLRFVAAYILLDATQMILAGALRGAGDTWFVLAGGFGVSAAVLIIATLAVQSIAWTRPGDAYQSEQLAAWWWTITTWVAALVTTMTLRYRSGGWHDKRMV